MQKEQQHLDQQAILREMVPVIAHKMRNLLATIVANVEYLQQNLPPADPLVRSTTRVREGASELDRVIADMLLACQPLNFHPTPCNIPDILDSILASTAPRLEAGRIAVKTRYPDKTLDMQGDAMPEGGCLDIAVMNGSSNNIEPLDGQEKNPGCLQISVTDTGVGVPTHILDRIYDPFFTTKANSIGLGLTIASRILFEHGGDITVHSEQGSGTTCHIELPARR